MKMFRNYYFSILFKMLSKMKIMFYKLVVTTSIRIHKKNHHRLKIQSTTELK